MKRMKKWLCCLLAVGMILCLVACDNSNQEQQDPEQQSETRVVTDMLGNEVEIPQEVESIAIATPVHTIFAMVSGAVDKLVTWPMSNTELTLLLYPQAEELPNPFGADANMESLIDIDPDVVILADGSDYIEPCKEMGLPVVLIDHSDFEQLMTSILTIAEVAGPEEYAQAQKYVEYFHENEQLVTERLADLAEEEKVRAAYLWGADDELYSYGSDTVQHAFLSAIGAQNAFDYLVTYKNISLEDVLAADLDAIVCSRKVDYDVITTAAEWASIPAVANGCVYYCPKGMNGFIAVQPELALGILWGASCLYPQQMEGIDLNQEIKDYYQQFMNYSLSDEQVEKILTQAY